MQNPLHKSFSPFGEPRPRETKPNGEVIRLLLRLATLSAKECVKTLEKKKPTPICDVNKGTNASPSLVKAPIGPPSDPTLLLSTSKHADGPAKRRCRQEATTESCA